MTIMPMETTTQMSPQLVDVVRTTSQLSASERLFLAKVLLDSLSIDEVETIAEQRDDPVDQLPTLEEVVAQIKATPPNPQQIQRATKTIDEVLADWQETPSDEPHLTTEEWEQSWWAVRQAMKQRDQNHETVTSWIAHEHDALPAGHQSPFHNGH